MTILEQLEFKVKTERFVNTVVFVMQTLIRGGRQIKKEVINEVKNKK